MLCIGGTLFKTIGLGFHSKVGTIGDKGGVDLMYAIGEPNGEAKTMGSQRPALL